MSKSNRNTASDDFLDKIVDKPRAGSETHWERLADPEADTPPAPRIEPETAAK